MTGQIEGLENAGPGKWRFVIFQVLHLPSCIFQLTVMQLQQSSLPLRHLRIYLNIVSHTSVYWSLVLLQELIYNQHYSQHDKYFVEVSANVRCKDIFVHREQYSTINGQRMKTIK